MNKIPQFRANELCKKAHTLCMQLREASSPQREDELLAQFREISRIALREGVLPTVLYGLYLKNYKQINTMLVSDEQNYTDNRTGTINTWTPKK